jgi:nicotinate-nucleotide pyrophosphorylase (carboxylating)
MRSAFPFKVKVSDEYLRAIIACALCEDIPRRDLTTELTVKPGARASAVLLTREAGVAAGLGVFAAVFKVLDPTVSVRTRAKAEGKWFGRGESLAHVQGPARSILSGERVALNFVQRLSGIATLTRRFVERVEGTGVRILDTRKTTPGLRALEKYAVTLGGGFNHRPNLSDLVLIKDNHIAAAGGIREAVARVRKAKPKVPFEVEVAPGVDAASLRDLDIDILMFDNWKPGPLKAAIREVRRFPSKPLVEVSGRIRLANVREFALARPDFISVGCLTHSAPALDLGLDFERAERHGGP